MHSEASIPNLSLGVALPTWRKNVYFQLAVHQAMVAWVGSRFRTFRSRPISSDVLACAHETSQVRQTRLSTYATNHNERMMRSKDNADLGSDLLAFAHGKVAQPGLSRGKPTKPHWWISLRFSESQPFWVPSRSETSHLASRTGFENVSGEKTLWYFLKNREHRFALLKGKIKGTHPYPIPQI